MIRGMFSERFLRNISKYTRPEEAQRFLRLDRYWIPEIAERLLARVDELTPKKPQQALPLAEIGAKLVERIRNAPPDLRMHASCSLGGALRAIGNLIRAEATFNLAEPLLASCSISVQAMFVRQQAILLIHQGHSDEAIRLAEKAVALDRSTGAVPTKSLLTEGAIRYFRGEFERSCQCFKEVLEVTDPSSDIYTFAMKNLAGALSRQNVTIKEIRIVRQLLRDVQNKIKGLRETPVRYMMWHIEGVFHGLLDEFYKAQRHLNQALDGFERIGQVGDMVRVTIDLVDMYFQKGDPENARVAIEDAAHRIASFSGYEDTVALLDRALEGPITEAADFIRERLSAALALRVELPGEE